MRYDKPVVAKFDKDKKRVSVSVAVSEDAVLSKKMSIEQFRMIVAQFNQIVYEIDNNSGE